VSKDDYARAQNIVLALRESSLLRASCAGLGVHGGNEDFPSAKPVFLCSFGSGCFSTPFDELVCQVLRGEVESSEGFSARLHQLDEQADGVDGELARTLAYGIARRSLESNGHVHWGRMTDEGKLWHAMVRVCGFLMGVYSKCTVVVAGCEGTVLGERDEGVVSVGPDEGLSVRSSILYAPRHTVIRGDGFTIDAGDAPLLVIVRRGLELKVIPPRSKRSVDLVVLPWAGWVDVLWSSSWAVPAVTSCAARLFRDCGVVMTVLGLPGCESREVFPLALAEGCDNNEAVVTYGLNLNVSRGLPSFAGDCVLAPSGQTVPGVGLSTSIVSRVVCDRLSFDGDLSVGFAARVGPSLDYCGVGSGSRRLVHVIKDEYAFDGGGPSDFDFSEGY